MTHSRTLASDRRSFSLPAYAAPLALVRDYFQRGAWGFAAVAAVSLMVPSGIFWGLERSGGLVHNTGEDLTLHFILMIGELIAFGLAAMAAVGRNSYLYAWPISTGTLAASLLAAGMASVALSHAAVSSAVNLAFGRNWPIVAPALWMAAAFALTQAVVWLAEKHVLLQGFCYCVTTTAAALWLQWQQGGFLAEPSEHFRTLGAGDVVTLAVVAALAFLIGRAGLARDRRGEAQPWRGWGGQAAESDLARPERVFASATSAQHWLEWRRKGLLLPGSLVFVQVTITVIWAIAALIQGHWNNPQHFVETVSNVGMMLPAFGLFIGMIIGVTGKPEIRSEMSSFLATRPLNDQAIARAILWVAAINVGLGCLWWLAGRTVVLATIWRHLQTRLTGWEEVGLWLIIALAAWATTALSACAMLTGRLHYFLLGVCVVCVVGWAGGLTASLIFPPAVMTILGQAWMVTSAIVFLAATIWAFWIALRQSLVSWNLTAWSLAFWAVAATVTLSNLSRRPGWPIVALFTLGALALVVLPLPAAPLAARWNRHR